MTNAISNQFLLFVWLCCWCQLLMPWNEFEINFFQSYHEICMYIFDKCLLVNKLFYWFHLMSFRCCNQLWKWRIANYELPKCFFHMSASCVVFHSTRSDLHVIGGVINQKVSVVFISHLSRDKTEIQHIIIIIINRLIIDTYDESCGSDSSIPITCICKSPHMYVHVR